jgi:hypothetical protein
MLIAMRKKLPSEARAAESRALAAIASITADVIEVDLELEVTADADTDADAADDARDGTVARTGPTGLDPARWWKRGTGGGDLPN